MSAPNYVFHATKLRVGGEPFIDLGKKPVQLRGHAPDDFLTALVEWAHDAHDDIFALNDSPDVYGSVRQQLGPWKGEPGSREWFLHRKAVMLECLRVLAGFESSWRIHTGADTNNPAENSPDTWSAGWFQVSANSLGFGEDLREVVRPFGILRSVRDGGKFRTLMMNNGPVSIEYTARLLRHTVMHNGPVKRQEINEFLSRDAVEEFMAMIVL